VTVRGAGPGATVLEAGGQTDGVLLLNTGGTTLEGITIRQGLPAGIYAFNSRDITLQDLELVENGIGVHLDMGSRGTLRDSTITGSARDGVLIRRQSGALVTGNRIFRNGVVGVSAVGDTTRIRVLSNRIEENAGPGIFAGVAPCHKLFVANLRSPACFSKDPARHVISADLIVEDNVIRDNGSTGLVFFPGAKALMIRNVVLNNDLTGLFAWGAEVNAYYNRFTGNEEHAVEYRSYPHPLYSGRRGEPFPMRARGWLIGNSLRTSREIDGILGGGLLSQGAQLVVFDNRVRNNEGIGISLVNDAIGPVFGNTVENNVDAAICVHLSATVRVFDNAIQGNFSDVPGSCAKR
jgi:nitrous oxidase accessory protein NosD